ncbi:MAG: iron ABC transporter substrate-binding protein, partial [Thermoplasmatota archaeon]
MKKGIYFFIVMLFLGGALAGCLDDSDDDAVNEQDTRLVIDMRGEEVRVPRNISRVIDISDGFTTSVMYSLGIADRVVGLGSTNLKEIDSYTFETKEGNNYSYVDGMNPVTHLSPR